MKKNIFLNENFMEKIKTGERKKKRKKEINN